MSYTPAYSHGGPSVPGWPAVAGNVTGSGRPISLLGADVSSPIQPCMVILYTGTVGQVVGVVLECNGGPLDSNGNPPAADWVDVSSGGYVLTIPGGGTPQKLAKLLAPVMPFWRTRITSIGGSITSYVPLIPTPTGVLVPASYPSLQAAQSLY
jgi:hypothetical protein